MEGDLELEQGAMWDLLEMVGRNRAGAPARPGAVMRVVHALERRLEQWNTRAASRRNVHVHYDLSTDLYRRFLDADMQ
ncbi:hypothetical protein RSW80_27040, partial [Escherichia coli]|nr:hypothetical protein [Escherichia coli]